MSLIFSSIVSLLNILTTHALLTRKKSIIYCMVTFCLNSLFIISGVLLADKYISDRTVFKYVIYSMAFMYIIYIHLIFSESLAKKMFTMFSIWMFSTSSLFFVISFAKIFLEVKEDIQNHLYISRISIQVCLLLLTYFCLNQRYKKVISLIPDKTLNFMLLYPFMAFLLLITNQTASIGVFRNFSSWQDMLLFLVFIILGYLLLFAGISSSSKMRQMQIKIDKEMARLDRLSLVGEMAASISHEVRNPMTTVRGFLQLLSTKEECSNYQHYYALMIDELDRANSIITEFLALAKDRVLELKEQNLKVIVENIFPLIQAEGLASDKNIYLELEEVDEIPLDKKEMHQLILNLVQNGSQAMLPGGTMKIRTYMSQEEIVLAVQDDGGGIPKEVLEKIGTPFFTTKENGTGLGLAICYSIAARHNAKIDIKTGPAGTTFFLRFRKI